MYRLVIAVVAVALVAAGGSAAAELELRNGERIRGLSLEREGANYLLELESGAVLTIPVELVVRAREGATSTPADRETEAESAPPLEIEIVADTEAVDAERKLSEAARSRGSFRTAAAFRRALTDPNWSPQNVYEPAPDLDDFVPSRWYRSPLDARWSADTDYSEAGDSIRFDASSWSRPAVRPNWEAEDGFSEDPP